MFKQIMTLLRGNAFKAEQDFADRNALPILSQQIRDAAHGVEAARKAVAVAMAQHKLEMQNGERFSAQLADLEERAVVALRQGKEEMAREAAQSIAFLEAELESSRRAQAEFSGGIETLRATVRKSEMRLVALQRGEKLATARDRTQRLVNEVPGHKLATLNDAEVTLERLQSRQNERELTSEALLVLRQNEAPSSIVEKLAEAGCGAALHATGDDILKRLREKAQNNP